MLTDLRFAAPPAAEGSQLRADGAAHAGGLHRRQHRHLQHRPVGAAASRCRCRRPSGSSSSTTAIRTRARRARRGGVPDYFDRLREMKVVRGAGDVSPEGPDLRRRGRRRAAAALRATPSFYRLAGVDARRRAGSSPRGRRGRQGRGRDPGHAIWQAASAAIPTSSAETCASTAVNTDRRRDAAGLQVPVERHRFVGARRVHAAGEVGRSRHSNNWNMIGRLKPGRDARRRRSSSSTRSTRATTSAFRSSGRF